ncbi:plasmid partitioning protein RepB [Notoacmeibacter sp. MSK16QG-6]|uniref:plasmid partitioning protein RepB n=1 Tax=Notoacmeibacter sp. MSK16QG-6 TaxID=2957982 RepID=UPI0020A13D3F|nr:plasmid partitioning protein RepB [Notoacmeibacter sp. MSK16QG-6]MCP1200632.1 plasmid partitioning protein RepB [Notoacmeibacter sp. MSK16QG-6]
MSKRRKELAHLFGTAEPAPNEPSNDAANTPSEPVKTRSPEALETKSGAIRMPSGAVRAMGLSLGGLSDASRRADELEKELARAERVHDIDPALIDPSPWRDRMSDAEDGDPDFDALAASIATVGQQVPVLLRPHPDKPSRYQVAFGHRRVHAAQRHSLSVRAVVKPLDDAELILAQGKENAERRDLSFIERAFFADAIIAAGFDRATAMQALGIDKTEMSRLLSVANTVPRRFAVAIGPAPKVGRPRWMALGELLQKKGAIEKAEDEIGRDRFLAADSDGRFSLLSDRLSGKPAKRKGEARRIAGPDGLAIGTLSLQGDSARLALPGAAASGFADYLAERLPELVARFREERGGR